MTAGALLAALIGIAMLDSINPSALAMTAYILLQAPERLKYKSVIAYVCGIFVTYLLLGAALITGSNAALAALPNGSGRWLAGAQIILGSAMILWAVIPHKKQPKRKVSLVFKPSAMAMLGGGVTIVELSTAFPYFAALGLLQQTHVTAINKAVLLLAYNIIFVLPPLTLLSLYKVRGVALVERIQRKISGRQDSSNTMLWIVGIIGAMLVLDNVGVFLGK